MKKQKSSNLETSGFWKPEKIGDSLDGKFICFSKSEKGLVLNSTCGAIGINSKPLKDIFRTVYKNLSPKDNIKIVFTGYGKNLIKGNYPRLFTVFINGKEIKANFTPIEISKKELDDFFAE